MSTRRQLVSSVLIAGFVVSAIFLSLRNNYGQNVTSQQKTVQTAVAFSVDEGDNDGEGVQPVEIPSGKILVIEHVSARARGRSGQTWMVTIGRVSANGGDVFDHSLVMEWQLTQGIHGFLEDFQTASQPIRLYLRSGDSLLVRASRNDKAGATTFPGAADVVANFSGHFENASY